MDLLMNKFLNEWVLKLQRILTVLLNEALSTFGTFNVLWERLMGNKILNKKRFISFEPNELQKSNAFRWKEDADPFRMIGETFL